MDATAPPDELSHEKILSILARADVGRIKSFAQELISPLGDIEVVKSRTGLVMLPMRDTAQGVAFHLGEVLVSEAHITSGEIDGYGMMRGRDLEAAMAMALIDLALAKNVSKQDCLRFLSFEATAQKEADRVRLCKVEATRVEMETF